MSTAQRECIWIVDDVALELEASRQALSETFRVEVFSSGEAMLERASGELPDVLVLDWHMDGMSGLDVLRFLRSQPETEALPILVFTATGDRDDLLDALDAGADDYVGKGSSNEELTARVNTLIRAKNLRRRAERAEADLADLLVRERAARAEAEAANRAKDLFLATVSHELRNPLSAILGWARLLKVGGLDAARSVRAVDTIERNALAQARIIDDLFDVARIVSGGLRLELAPLDLARAIEQAVETTRPSAAVKRIEIVSELAPCMVDGDGARLEQVALNLLSNAVKFTPMGGSVTVSLRRAGDQAVLTVADTGPGISPVLLPFVFERFRQGDATITRTHGGLGLGLAIVRQVVEQHGGAVVARNSADSGAIFEVTLPLLPVTSPPVAHPGRRTPPGNELDGLVVLVVEDDPDGRALLVAVLSDHGATPIEAESADEAIEQLGGNMPDVILSDIAMPGRDGYSLLQEVRETLRLDVPAIAVTALVRDQDRLDAMAAGFQRHLTKPIDTEELVRVVLEVTGSTE